MIVEAIAHQRGGDAQHARHLRSGVKRVIRVRAGQGVARVRSGGRRVRADASTSSRNVSISAGAIRSRLSSRRNSALSRANALADSRDQSNARCSARASGTPSTSPNVFANASSMSGRKPRNSFSMRRASSRVAGNLDLARRQRGIARRGARRMRAGWPARRADSGRWRLPNAGRRADGRRAPKSPTPDSVRAIPRRCAGLRASRAAPALARSSASARLSAASSRRPRRVRSGSGVRAADIGRGGRNGRSL